MALCCDGVVVRSDAGVVFGVGACVLVDPGVVVLCGDGRVVDVTWHVVCAIIRRVRVLGVRVAPLTFPCIVFCSEFYKKVRFNLKSKLTKCVCVVGSELKKMMASVDLFFSQARLIAWFAEPPFSFFVCFYVFFSQCDFLLPQVLPRGAREAAGGPHDQPSGAPQRLGNTRGHGRIYGCAQAREAIPCRVRERKEGTL